MDRTTKLRRGKLVRRLLVLFFLCTAAATAGFGLLSYDRQAEAPQDQTEQRLRQASKTASLKLHERLVQLDRDLRGLDGALDPLTGRTVGGNARVDLARDRFSALALAPRRGHIKALVGVRIDPPSLTARQREHLAQGRTLLVTEPVGEAARVYLARKLAGSDSLLIGEASPSYLLEVFLDNPLTPFGEFCVLDEERRPVGCSFPRELIQAAQSALGSGSSGYLEWGDGDEEEQRVAGYASILLEPSFQHRQWMVLLSERRSDAPAAPAADFPTSYPLLILLSILLVALLSIDQIRRPTVPLEELQELTRRIAEGSFDVDIEVESGDEFEELAASFRSMASRLKLQFEKLEKLIEVDREVLSAMELGRVADTAVVRIRDLYACDGSAVAVVNPDDPDSLLVVVSDPEHGTRRLKVAGFDRKQKRQLTTSAESIHFDHESGIPHFLEPLAESGMKEFVALPLMVEEDLAGVLVAAHRHPEDADSDQLPYARALARQASVALSNIRTIEENRALAYYDRLTGLPNRLLFRERLDQALARARRLSTGLAALVLDLDHFKRINDTFGHELGDRLLRMVGERLNKGMRGGTLARLGGDEFAVLLPDLRNVEQAARIARTCIESLADSFSLNDQEVFVTASIGIAVFPDDAADAEALMRNADAAMYHAKDRGRNGFQFYASSMNEEAVQRLALEADLRRALEREELRLYYQPIVDISQNEIVGMEALLRWQHSERGMVMPDQFIPIAEDTGLIVPIGQWVLRTACTQNKAWRRSGLPSLRVAVNLSSRQLADEDLLRIVKRALAESGTYPQNLGLELTERMLVNADDATLRTLRGFRELGVRLSIDDFGTGYSSLAYLKNFPVDVLKVDRSFVRDVTSGAGDAAIVRAIIAMAHGLKLSVVAEGVETEEQLAFLRAEGCDAAQGMLFSEPLPADGFEKLLREWES